MECGKGYYSILGVSLCSSDEEIRRAYRRLAMQWHPDKWSRTPAILGEAKQKFQQIQEAYSVLSDRKKRTLYDAGLYDSADEEDEVEGEYALRSKRLKLGRSQFLIPFRASGFTDFLGEMVSLINDARKEEKTYSIGELRSMFWEMAQGFEIPEWTSYLQQPAIYNTECFNGPFS